MEFTLLNVVLLLVGIHLGLPIIGGILILFFITSCLIIGCIFDFFNNLLD